MSPPVGDDPTGGRPAGDDPIGCDPVEAGLPDGVIELALCLHRRAATLLGRAVSGGVDRPEATADRDRVLDLLTAPLRLGEDWPAPVEPTSVGAGWVHVEVIDDDRTAFEAVMVDRADAGPEALARTCQELRFPVSPYRALRRPLATYRRPPRCHRPEKPNGRNPVDPSGLRVVDLTTHWAGPLVTKLLAETGAEVVKIDPDCRPDGFRDHPELFRHLNEDKEIVDLDLRSQPDRLRFESLVADADLIVESFSRRVMA
ncbi:MAG: CoA transferase, partial [Acidimicrobiales bacterium]